jgi:hypothetical protein
VDLIANGTVSTFLNEVGNLDFCIEQHPSGAIFDEHRCHIFRTLKDSIKQRVCTVGKPNQNYQYRVFSTPGSFEILISPK